MGVPSVADSPSSAVKKSSVAAILSFTPSAVSSPTSNPASLSSRTSPGISGVCVAPSAGAEGS